MNDFFVVLGLLFVVPIIIAVLVLIIYIFIRNKRKKCVEFLMHNSLAIKNLFEINKKYNFYSINEKIRIENTYDSKDFFDEISCQDYLIYQLQFNRYDFEQEIKLLNLNRKMYNSYCREIKNLVYGEFTEEVGKINKNYLIKLERRIVKANSLKPLIEYEIEVKLYRSNLKGEIYESKKEIFNSNKVFVLIYRLKNKNGNFYNDREIWDSLCRVERGHVSKKLRLEIYKRDGFRCRCCGRTDTEVDLEIDHIKPISKGGKSTYDNLQTLCRDCNQKKGNMY